MNHAYVAHNTGNHRSYLVTQHSSFVPFHIPLLRPTETYLKIARKHAASIATDRFVVVVWS